MQDITQQIQDSDDALKAFIPPGPHKVWQVDGFDAKGEEHHLQFVQTELSFFEKQDFTTLLTGYLDRFASGEFGISIGELMGSGSIEIPTEVTADDAEQFVQNNTSTVEAIVKVVNTLPDLQMKIILLAMGVPEGQKKFVAEVLRGPRIKGGLSDEQGFEILKTFISLNAGPIRDFFLEKGQDLVKHFQKEVMDQGSETEGDEEQQIVEVEATETEIPASDSPGGTPSSITPHQPDSIPATSDDGPPKSSSSSTTASSEER